MAENQKEKKDGTWAEDQKDRGYYYDDAHGYEEYRPEGDEDECVEDIRSDEGAEAEEQGKPVFRTC
jgi:hypothetical protein